MGDWEHCKSNFCTWDKQQALVLICVHCLDNIYKLHSVLCFIFLKNRNAGSVSEPLNHKKYKCKCNIIINYSSIINYIYAYLVIYIDVYTHTYRLREYNYFHSEISI